MGTHLYLTASAGRDDFNFDGLFDIAVNETQRLEKIFSAYDPQSELERFKRGEEIECSPEFVELLGLALEFQASSEGAFNPASGVLSDLWREGARLGKVPSDVDLLAACEAIQAPLSPLSILCP